MRKIEALSSDHDRDGFDCGNELLNSFLCQTARQHRDRGISRTYVLVDEKAAVPKQILGFFTINICQLTADELPEREAKKLPRSVSGVKLGRLAVARAFQRQGIGKLLLVAALEKFEDIFKTAGGVGLFVDAKDEAAKRYYEQFGFVPLPSNGLRLFLPHQTIRQALGKVPRP